MVNLMTCLGMNVDQLKSENFWELQPQVGHTHSWNLFPGTPLGSCNEEPREIPSDCGMEGEG